MNHFDENQNYFNFINLSSFFSGLQHQDYQNKMGEYLSTISQISSFFHKDAIPIEIFPESNSSLA